MHNKKDSLFSVKDGEIRYNGNHAIAKRYQPETLFDRPIAPYLLMFICLTVDLAVFYSLFTQISYDSPMMLVIQLLGMGFCFDVTPLYLGINYRRYRQGLTKDWPILFLALIVFILAVLLNTVLHVATIDLRSPTVTMDTTQAQTDPTALALTLFGIVLPVLTSVGSFFVSYFTSNPLLQKKRNLEEAMNEVNDHIRRLEAILADYNAEDDHLEADDQAKFHAMQMMIRAKLLSACNDVREPLKEHLADPAANSALSDENYPLEVLERFERELMLLGLESNKKDSITALNAATYPQKISA